MNDYVILANIALQITDYQTMMNFMMVKIKSVYAPLDILSIKLQRFI